LILQCLHHFAGQRIERLGAVHANSHNAGFGLIDQQEGTIGQQSF
jgi:hypothetical protein